MSSTGLDLSVHRASDRFAQVASALRAVSDLLAPTDGFSSLARDDLAMLLALLTEPTDHGLPPSTELAAARRAVIDMIGCRQELDGLTRKDLRALMSALAQVQAEAIVALSMGMTTTH